MLMTIHVYPRSVQSAHYHYYRPIIHFSATLCEQLQFKDVHSYFILTDLMPKLYYLDPFHMHHWE